MTNNRPAFGLWLVIACAAPFFAVGLLCTLAAAQIAFEIATSLLRALLS